MSFGDHLVALSDSTKYLILDYAFDMDSVACPVCHSQLTNLSYSAKIKKKVAANNNLKSSGSAKGGRNIYKCSDCEVYFCHPLPKQDKLLEEYDSSHDQAFVSQNEFRYYTFNLHFQRILSKLGLNTKDLYITDIGAATGVFLKVANDLGIAGCGYEANKWLVQYGRTEYNVNINQGSIDNFTPFLDKLNVVSLWDVLEHLSDPYTELKSLSSQLKSKSLIIISLPSTYSRNFKLLKWRWPMHLNVHLYYFNKKSLDRLFSSCGFRMIYSAKYGQRFSLGYLIYRAIMILFPNVSVNFFWSNTIFNRMPITYSVGQRIYLFEKL